VLGYTFRITIQLVALSLVTSIVATSLTAGRIMWISYQTKKHLGKQFAERYNMAFQVVVESGLIYSISLIIFLVGIVSTLIIVRVGLGVSAGDHGETMGTSGTSRSTGPHIRPPHVPPVVSVELSTIVISSGPTPMDRRHSVEQKHPESIDDVSSST
ncbi:hypothetical protein AB1N83_006766, partial [Pleurotus pulmonarius]